MLVTYFDEVKYQRDRQPFYWLAGIVVSDATLIELEEKVNVLSEKVFGTRELLKETEFHAADLLNGHEHFKGWSMQKRLEVLKEFVSIFGAVERDRIGKIYCKIDVERMIKEDPQDEAFMYFIERVDGYLRSRKEAGILIGDRESDSVASEFSERLSRFRLHGTGYSYGVKLTNLIDTVHFTSSHHSRMLQIADLYAWLMQFCAVGDQGKWHRKQVIDHVKSINDCLSPNKYKEWPTDGSWVKKA